MMLNLGIFLVQLALLMLFTQTKPLSLLNSKLTIFLSPLSDFEGTFTLCYSRRQ